MLKLVKTVYKDPATDPYALRHRDKIKDLDNDENRHLIKPIITVIAEDCKGCEHKFCDPDQLDEHGCYRRPKLVKEAECCGFANPMEMLVARKKEEEDKKQKEVDELRQMVKELSNSDSKIVNLDPVKLHGPLFSEAPEKIPNSEKIKNLLGWEPTKNVSEIIEEVVIFYKNRKQL